MIKEYAVKITTLIEELSNLIQEDIKDIKAGNPDAMIERDTAKQNLVFDIKNIKNELDQAIMKSIQNGENIEAFRKDINNVEEKLKTLNKLNNDLAYILLPVKDMYDNIIKDFFTQSQSAVNFSA